MSFLGFFVFGLDSSIPKRLSRAFAAGPGADGSMQIVTKFKMNPSNKETTHRQLEKDGK